MVVNPITMTARTACVNRAREIAMEEPLLLGHRYFRMTTGVRRGRRDVVRPGGATPRVRLQVGARRLMGRVRRPVINNCRNQIRLLVKFYCGTVLPAELVADDARSVGGALASVLPRSPGRVVIRLFQDKPHLPERALSFRDATT